MGQTQKTGFIVIYWLNYLRNRFAKAVVCCLIYHWLEVNKSLCLTIGYIGKVCKNKQFTYPRDVAAFTILQFDQGLYYY